MFNSTDCNGGFDITVGGHTHLAGGVIASSAEASKNVLDTGSLTYEHLKNEANYSASSTGLSAGYGSEGFNASPSLGMPQSGHSASETKAGIAEGTIIVRDGNADLSGLDRNPTLADQTLAPIFDAQKVQEQMEMGQLMGQVGMRAAGDLAGKMGWPEGSPERTLLHGLVGVGMAALGGGDVTQAVLGAGANQLVIQKMAEFLESQGYEKGTPEFATMLQLGSAAIGAAVGEGSGAAAALAGTQYNYLTHLQLETLDKQINQCKGDAVCIQTAKSDAEMLSARQEQDLIHGCNAAGVYCASNYANSINDAINYINDPLAAKLGLQVDQSITAQSYANDSSQWGLVYGDNVVSREGNMMLGLAAAGMTAGMGSSGALGALAAEAYDGTQFGALWQVALASRTGTALTTGAVNLGAQLLENGGHVNQLNYIDLSASMLGGYLGYGGNMAWNGLVGTGVGMVQTEANNLYYGENNNVLLGGLTSGVTTAAGFKAGDAYANWMSTPTFTSLGPVVSGNAAGASTTEGLNAFVEKWKDEIIKANNEKHGRK